MRCGQSALRSLSRHLPPRVMGLSKIIRRRRRFNVHHAAVHSERKYEVIVERDVKVVMPRHMLGRQIFAASDEKFPVVISASTATTKTLVAADANIGFTPRRGYMESGDSTFSPVAVTPAVYSRGTGKSGFLQLMGHWESNGCRLIDGWQINRSNAPSAGVRRLLYARCQRRRRMGPNREGVLAFADRRLGHRCTRGFAHGSPPIAQRLHGTIIGVSQRHLAEDYKEAIAQACRVKKLPRCGDCASAQNPEWPNALIVDIAVHPSGPSGAGAARKIRMEKFRVYRCLLGQVWLASAGAFTAWREWQGPKDGLAADLLRPPVFQ